jgi:hypothetical protein
VIICTVAIGTQAHIEKAAVEASGLLNATKLGWQLLYILPVAIVFNSSSPLYNRLHQTDCGYRLLPVRVLAACLLLQVGQRSVVGLHRCSDHRLRLLDLSWRHRAARYLGRLGR